MQERKRPMDPMVWVWLAVVIAAVIVEGYTAQLVSIWFAVGALVALIAGMANVPLWGQLLLFAAVSLLTVLLTRPLVRRRITPRREATNADRYVGMQGVVLQAIDNVQGKGQVKVQGSIWTARAEQEDGAIPENAAVTVVRIEGARLIVRP